MKMISVRKKSIQNGIIAIELVIMIAILSAAFFGVYQTGIFYLQSFEKIEKSVKAAYLAEEAMEAVRGFRREKTWSGAGGIGGLATGSNYYPSSTTGEWLMVSGQESIGGTYARRIVFDRVSRDANDDIESVYNPVNDDPDTRKVTAEVSWDGGTKQVALATYITNILGD